MSSKIFLNKKLGEMGRSLQWRYRPAISTQVGPYVEQFYGHTRMLFQKKLYYRKLIKKAKQVWVVPSGPYVSTWAIEAGTQLFQTFWKRGLTRGGEKLWAEGLFGGIKKWLLCQQQTLRFVLATQGSQVRYWGRVLRQLRNRHRGLIQLGTLELWTAPSTQNKERWFRWQPQTSQMIWQGRGRQLIRFPLAHVLWMNVCRILVRWRSVSFHWVSLPFLRLFRQKQKLIFFRKRIGWSRLVRTLRLPATWEVKYVTQDNFQGSIWSIFPPTSLSEMSLQPVQRRRLPTSTFTLRVKKEVVYRRKRRIRTVWVVEKYYQDVDVGAIVQQELLDPAYTYFAVKEVMEKSNARRRLSKQEKEEEQKKKRKRLVRGYLLGMPNVRRTQNVALFRRFWLMRKGKQIGMTEQHVREYLTHQICRLLCAKPTVFADNVLRHERDLRRQKRITKRLPRRTS